MKRIVFIILCISFAIQAKAQTTGPTQPEAAGFAPIGADDMVNLYTGDLNYNIPLMVIPGPDGGYPINMFYNSNVGMDQAASWVGLGWNLNAGAIQRNLRGTPDDFKGDKIKKEFYTKPSTTIKIDFRSPLFKKIFKKEIAGADFEKSIASLNLKGSFSIYYNNYSGIGINSSLGTTLSQTDEYENVDGFTAGLGLSFGSQEGFSLSPNLSYDFKNKSMKYSDINGLSHSLRLGTTINSKQGFNDLNLSMINRRFKVALKETNDYTRFASSDLNKRDLGKLSFASSAPISLIKANRTSLNGNFSFTTDPKKTNLILDNESVTLSGSFTRSWITNKEKEVEAYGAMYMADWQDQKYKKKIITDFYRENEGPITKDRVLTPIPVLTYDIFSIQGHGVSGSFRAYQNSIGKLSDAKNTSTSTSIGLGFELGLGAGVFKAGSNINASYAGSNSGPWKNPNYYFNQLIDYEFNRGKHSKPLFEPFYFKMIGESSALDTTVWNEFQLEKPIAFDINRRWDWNILAAKAQAHSQYNRSGNVFEGKENEGRNPRLQNIEYYTKKNIEDVYTSPHIVSSSQLVPIDYASNGENHHLNGISVLKPNGVRYNYFLPAYNHTTKKVTFAIPGKNKYYDSQVYTKDDNPKIIDKVDYRGNVTNIEDLAKKNNGAGDDEFFSKETIPAYAHTFFITSILSQDYVDIKNDGPTEDDLGTYVKMNYEKVSNYKWRFPFKGAYYSKGYLDNYDDDKASYQEGSKDLFYVKSIETKTHVAVFETKNAKLYDADRNKYQKELVSISLYSKADPNWTPQFYLNVSVPQPTPIQTVHLNQEYSLKANTPNSDATDKMVPALKELYFTYQNSTRGEDAKYKFKYGENPAYQDHEQDRWGAYQQDFSNVKVQENPYTYQNESYPRRDKEAAAWLLDEITLPSNGTINIDYGKDDYAYVQDKKATSFIKLKGTGKSANGGMGIQMKNDDLYLFFESPYKLNSDADAEAMVEGMEYLRFRVYMQLKYSDKIADKAYDYVEGYAKILSAGKRSDYIGYVQIDDIRPKIGSSKLNPIRLATFQYIRKSRPDLGLNFDLSSNSWTTNAWVIPFAARNLLAMLNEASVLATGYYRTALLKGWAPSMSLDKPSYIRLISPKRKYGGGSRVRKITLKSDEPGARAFGQTYHYTLKDGRSSGVAEWEPILGIEENPFTKPIWFNANNNGHKIIFSNEQSFSEEPLGAGLYPSASVGYSRVTVRNLEEKFGRVKFAQSGINVSEFYTARDFPTKAERSGALFAPYWVPVFIPFIGEQNTRYNGYSMGYSFTLNNAIYGRPKSVATYPYATGEPTGEPVQKSVYKYKTLVNNAKALDNKVTTLLKEGVKKDVFMGKEIDFYIDEIEANTYSIGAGSQLNISVDARIPAFLPTWFPSINTGRKGTRYLTTNKIIYNTPILDSIIQYKDGAKVSTKNLVFDHETGEPIITSVTNEWKQPIYTYNFPAHWSYEQMKGAYRNYRAGVKIDNATGGKFKLNAGLTSSGQIPEELFQEGDVLIGYDNKKYYISEIDRLDNKFNLKARDNSVPLITSGSTSGLVTQFFEIMKSGYKNLQSTKKGKIVSLQDLSGEDPYPTQVASFSQALSIVMRSFNSSQPAFPRKILYKDSIYNGSDVIDKIMIPECNIEYEVGYSYFKAQNKLTFSFGSSSNSECTFNSIVVPVALPNDTDFSKFRFLVDTYDPSASTIKMMYLDPSNTVLHRKTFLFSVQDLQNCFDCEQRMPITILHADATEFSEDWEFNYSELDDQSTDISSSLSDIANNSTLGNPYAFGLKGIWRPKRTSAYLIDRLQTGTNGDRLRLDKDGEYKEFYWFDWKQPIQYNEDYNWRWVNEVTQYNVNGASKEGRNRLDIHAASLFGYNNHLVTASASNSKTTDIAFDGFEDYGSSLTGYSGLGHGNLNFSKYSFYDEGHTGNRSLNIGSCNGVSPLPRPNYCTSTYSLNPDFFQPKLNQRYYISGWTKYLGGLGRPRSEIVVRINSVSKYFKVKSSFGPLDGWYKIDGYFDVPNSLTNFFIILGTGSSDGYAVLFDDIRIQPFNSGMETYVYDPTNYRLRATLSNQNYATFYNYDEEGNLTQTKVETERGIKTISSNRNNIKK